MNDRHDCVLFGIVDHKVFHMLNIHMYEKALPISVFSYSSCWITSSLESEMRRLVISKLNCLYMAHSSEQAVNDSWVCVIQVDFCLENTWDRISMKFCMVFCNAQLCSCFRINNCTKAALINIIHIDSQNSTFRRSTSSLSRKIFFYYELQDIELIHIKLRVRVGWGCEKRRKREKETFLTIGIR
jgi:hypothetical protein